MNLLEQLVDWFGDPARLSGPGNIPQRLVEHVALSGGSLLIALAIALPVGIWIGHTRRGAAVAINAANLGRAVPSLAVIALVIPISAAIDPQLGFRVIPTVVAMVVLGIPPILVNTYTGIAAVDADLVESARGMGFRESGILREVELPVALPVIVGGVRSAAVQIVATATLGAIFGSGGLGRYLVEGIAQNDTGMIFGGVVLVAGLALATEGLFAAVGWALTPRGLRRRLRPLAFRRAQPAR